MILKLLKVVHDDQSHDIKFFEMDPLLPIYEQDLRKGMETKNVVEILSQPNENAVAQAVPTSVSINAVFVVDVASPHVMHYKNVLADDLGAWVANGMKHRVPSKTRIPIAVSKDVFNDATYYHRFNR